MNVPASAPEAGGSRPGLPVAWKLLRSLVLWLLLYAILLSLYNRYYDLTSDVLIRWFQVVPAAAILDATLPGVPIAYTSTVIKSPELELVIMRGCDGVEAWLMLLSALVVFPMAWRHRLKGMLWGTLMLFALNLFRIVSLFHLWLVRPDWFDLAHGVVWQSAIVLAAAAFVLSWLGMDRKDDAGKVPAGADAA